jgi:hypothetical protein
MLVIRDEQLTKKLRQIAERENRPVEDVLLSMVAQYPDEAPEKAVKSEKSEAVRQVRHKVYNKARQYWESVGDTAKAAMTDEEFGAFDEEGIPRLKSELDSLEPPPGSLAYAAMIASRSNLRLNTPDLASRSREMLIEHFADDYWKRKNENADQ